MKNTSLYAIPIAYMLVYVLLILVSGLWLFLLSQGLENTQSVMQTLYAITQAPQAKSIRGIIEVATPHLFAMGTLIFVVAHFMLFSTNIPQKISLSVAMALFAFALLDIFVYFAITFGLLVSGWIKLFAMAGFVLLFASLLLLLAFSL